MTEKRRLSGGERTALVVGWVLALLVLVIERFVGRMSTPSTDGCTGNACHAHLLAFAGFLIRTAPTVVFLLGVVTNVIVRRGYVPWLVMGLSVIAMLVGIPFVVAGSRG